MEPPIDDLTETAERASSLGLDQIGWLVARYRREMARYEKAAGQVAERLRRELRQAGIKHMVSHRPKHPDDLFGKLELKARKKPETYTWEILKEDIGRVVTDLAGCRVVVYSPEDEAQVGSLLPRWFEQPDRPDAAIDRRRGVHSPYWATHALVHPHRAGDPPDPTIEGAICEVQIVTVAAHLFNEIEHDITFKERNAQVPADDEERQLLDELRGVARVADRIVSALLLRRQQRAADTRELITDPEDLRFRLGALAGRYLRGGEVARLLGLLEQNIDRLTSDALRGLGDVEELIQRGRDVLAGEAPDDDIILYTIGLFEQHFRDEIVLAASRWRGPKTALREMIELAAERTQRQGGGTR